MAVDTGALKLKVEVETSQAQSDLQSLQQESNKAEKELNNLGAEADEAGNDLKEFGNDAEVSESKVANLTTSLKGLATSLGGLTIINQTADDILNLGFASAELNLQLGLTNEDINELSANLSPLNNALGITNQQFATSLSIIAPYVTSVEGLTEAYIAVALGAFNYAQREGDVTQANQMMEMSFSSLRDAVMFGSTTFWEDAQVDVYELSQALLALGVTTDLTTTNTAEYTESLWRNATASQRLSAITTVMKDEFKELLKLLPEETQQILLVKSSINELKETIKLAVLDLATFILTNQQVIKVLAVVLVSIGVLAAALIVYNLMTATAAMVTGVFNGILKIYNGAIIAVTTAKRILNKVSWKSTLIFLLIIAVVWLVIKVFKNWEEIIKVVGKVFAWFAQTIGAIFSWLWNSIFKPILQLINKFLVQPTIWAVTTVVDAIKWLAETIKSIFDWVWSTIFVPIGKILYKLFVEPFLRSVQMIKDAFNSLVDFFVGIWDSITNIFASGVNAIINLLNKIPFVDIPNVGSESSSSSASGSNSGAFASTSRAISSRSSKSGSASGGGGLSSTKNTNNYNLNFTIGRGATRRDGELAIQGAMKDLRRLT